MRGPLPVRAGAWCYPPPMPQPDEVVIRDCDRTTWPPPSRSSSTSFLDFPALQVMAGTDAGARARMARMFAMEFEPEAHDVALVAELDGRIVGALTYTDSPAARP